MIPKVVAHTNKLFFYHDNVSWHFELGLTRTAYLCSHQWMVDGLIHMSGCWLGASVLLHVVSYPLGG